MGVETSKGISNQNTSLRGTSGLIEPGSACFSKLVETGEWPTITLESPTSLEKIG